MTAEDLQQIAALITSSEERIVSFVRAELSAEIGSLRAEIKEAEARAQEFARDIETNLLRAFHGHAKAQTARQHTTEIAAADLAIRMANIEERVLNLETRRPSQQ
jgi:hypothetical protein